MSTTMVTNPYSHIPAVKQHHRNGCWAACLEWYGKRFLGCSTLTQDDIRSIKEVKAMYKSDSTTGTRFRRSGEKYGTLEKHELMLLLGCAPWFLNAEEITNFSSATLQTRLNKGPVVVGFYDLSGNTWHVNIICGYDANSDMAVVMEPFTGEFEDKSFSDFTIASPFNVLGSRY